MSLPSQSIKQLEKTANALKAMAHPLRLAILLLLEKESPLSVTEIYNQLNIEQAVASHHLTNMKSKGVLESTREGNQTFYYIKHTEVALFVKNYILKFR